MSHNATLTSTLPSSFVNSVFSLPSSKTSIFAFLSVQLVWLLFVFFFFIVPFCRQASQSFSHFLNSLLTHVHFHVQSFPSQEPASLYSPPITVLASLFSLPVKSSSVRVSVSFDYPNFCFLQAGLSFLPIIINNHGHRVSSPNQHFIRRLAYLYTNIFVKLIIIMFIVKTF